MNSEKAHITFKNLQYRINEIKVEGFTEEAAIMQEQLDSVMKKCGVRKPDYFKRERLKAKHFAEEVYAWVKKCGDLVEDERGRIITKRDVRHYLMYVKGRTDIFASQTTSRNQGRWLYQALLYGAIEELGGDVWRIID